MTAEPGRGAVGWQPIETAPRDGTAILARRSPGVIEIVRWEDYPDYGVYGWSSESYDDPWTHWRPLL